MALHRRIERRQHSAPCCDWCRITRSCGMGLITPVIGSRRRDGEGATIQRRECQIALEAIEHGIRWRLFGSLHGFSRNPGFNQRKAAGSLTAPEDAQSEEAGWVVFGG